MPVPILVVPGKAAGRRPGTHKVPYPPMQPQIGARHGLPGQARQRRKRQGIDERGSTEPLAGQSPRGFAFRLKRPG